MQLMINIDKDYYEIIKHDVKNGMDYLPCVLIAHGMPLSNYEEHLKEIIEASVRKESEDK